MQKNLVLLTIEKKRLRSFNLLKNILIFLQKLLQISKKVSNFTILSSWFKKYLVLEIQLPFYSLSSLKNNQFTVENDPPYSSILSLIERVNEESMY
jgi:hypothetical protein